MARGRLVYRWLLRVRSSRERIRSKRDHRPDREYNMRLRVNRVLFHPKRTLVVRPTRKEPIPPTLLLEVLLLRHRIKGDTLALT